MTFLCHVGEVHYCVCKLVRVTICVCESFFVCVLVL